MPNEVVGDYDVAVHCTLGALNRVLAAIHQNRPPDHPVLLQSFTWALHGRSGVRGDVRVQLGAPSIGFPPLGSSVPGGRAVRADLHCELRALFTAAEGSAAFPETIHGTGRVPVGMGFARSPAPASQVLHLSFGHPAFTSAPGLPWSATDGAQMVDALQSFLTALGPVNQVIPLPASAPDFTVRAASLSRVPGPPDALAFLLTTSPLDPSTAATPSRSTLSPPDDVALVVGRDFLVSTLLRAVPRPTEPVTSQRFGLWDYEVRIDDLSVDLEPGDVVVTVRVSGSSETFGNPGTFSLLLRQRFSLRVDSSTGRVSLATPLADPELIEHRGDNVVISGILELGAPFLVRSILPVRNQLLGPLRDQLDTYVHQLDPSRLLHGLGVRGATFRYRAVDVERAGLVLHATLQLARRPGPAPAFTTDVTTSDVVLNAWGASIPGGTVRQFVWSYVSGDVPGLGPTVGRVTEEHSLRSVVPRNQFASGPLEVCLALEGVDQTRLDGSGRPSPVTLQSCEISVPRPPSIVVIESIPLELMIRPFVLLGAGTGDPTPWEVVAHVDPFRAAPALIGSSSGMLVRFVGSDLGAEVAMVGKALDPIAKGARALLIVAVLTPQDVQKLAVLPRLEPPAVVALGEDWTGGWRVAFGAPSQGEATYLVDGQGLVAWKQEGQLSVASLASAFDQHLDSKGTTNWQQLALGVQRGNRAPNFWFEHGEGEKLALSKLRGRPVLLVFWTTKSSASLAQLESLQRSAKDLAAQGTAVLAINDGDDADEARWVLEQYGLAEALVPDPERDISTLYRVNCWPTTLMVDESGQVVDIRLGLERTAVPKG